LRRRGTGSLFKALRLLSEIGSAEPEALRLTELVSRTDLESSTAFRMLACLVEEGFLQRVEGKRYRLGQRVFELGLIAGQHFQGHAAACVTLRRLSGRLGAPVTLDLRSGGETVHVGREGPPGAARLGPLGTRLPIGVVPGGVALLAAMSADDADRLIRDNERRYRIFGRDTSCILRADVDRARLDGFARIVRPRRPGVGSIGLIVPTAADMPCYALSTECSIGEIRGDLRLIAAVRTAAAEIAVAMAEASAPANMREEARSTPPHAAATLSTTA